MSTVITSLQQLLKSSPDKTLFEENERCLSALQLDQISSGYATLLYQLGVRPGQNVALLLPRGIDAAVAIYSIIKLGACYVPIDSKNPTSRQSFIINDAQCKWVIGEGKIPSWLTEIETTYVDIAQSVNVDNSYVPTTTISNTTSDKDNCAILYTSGSTGMPKGVVISAAAIMSFSNWATQTVPVDSSARIANLTPFHFDLSLFDLFAGPLIGATTVFIPQSLTLAPSKLADWLIEKKISCWYTVPSILGFLVYKGNLATKTLMHLKQILFAGEVFSTKKLIELTELLPTTQFYNLFGPSETNVCLFWAVNKQRLQADKAIPIGVAACGAQLKICSQQQQLLVKGPCLMNGYWNKGNLELPVDDEGWFQTGDRVSINARGEYNYHGRVDRMIKSAGYRIEPAEVEQALDGVSGVAGSVVIASNDPVSGTRLIAAVAGTNLDQRQIQRHMQQKLPAYMQPASYVFLEKLPLLSNGKIDYQKIKTTIAENNN